MKTEYKKISIIIPAYNEEKTIKKIIDKVKSAKSYSLKKEIIVVDDKSKDKTLSKISAFKNIKVVKNLKNYGKGYSLKNGFKHATGQIIITQDADMEYDPNEYELILKPILDGDADVVFGSRFMGNRPHRVLYYWHSVGNKLLTTFSNMLTNLNLTDMETGYKVFTGEIASKVIPEIESNRFGYEPEITAKIGKLVKENGCRVYEVGISYFGRTYKEGKKINWRDGLLAFWYIIKFNFLR